MSTWTNYELDAYGDPSYTRRLPSGEYQELRMGPSRSKKGYWRLYINRFKGPYGGHIGAKIVKYAPAEELRRYIHEYARTH